MKIFHLYAPAYLLFIMGILGSSCFGKTSNQSNDAMEIVDPISINKNTSKQGLSYVEHAIRCSLLDKNGILWFGSNQGIYSYDGNAFNYYSELGGLCNNNVYTIIEDKEGNIWFGTDGGMCKYDRKNFTSIALPRIDTSSAWLNKVYPVVNPNQVRSMLQAKDGLFWIGTNGGGAYSYNGKTFVSYLADKGRKQIDSLYHNIISSVIEDETGDIWFTSMIHGGVSRYDGEKFTHFSIKEGLSDDMVTSSLLDKSGNLWFGSLGNRNGTLDRFDGESFTSFHEKDGICNSNTWCMYEDKKGKIWLGSARGNLCTYTPELEGTGRTPFTEFVTTEGQTLSEIIFVLEDGKDNLWFGSSKGNLWKYDGYELIDFAKIK